MAIANWTSIGTPTSAITSTDRKVSGLQSIYIAGTTNDGVYQDVDGLESGESVIVSVKAAVVSGDLKLTVYDGGGVLNGVSEDYATALPSAEQLSDGDFESNGGRADWNYIVGTRPTTTIKHAGSYAAMIDSPSLIDPIMSTNAISTTSDVQITGWFYITHDGSVFANMLPAVRADWYKNGILLARDRQSLSTSTTSTWIEFFRRFTRPSGADSVVISFEWPWDESVYRRSGKGTIRNNFGAMYVDDLSILEVRNDYPFTELSVTKTVPSSGSVRVALLCDAAGSSGYFDDVELQLDTTQYVDSELSVVSNAHLNGRISHVVVADGASFGGNLLFDTAPFNLLPSVVAQNDALYIGSADAGGSLPFGSVAFDLLSGTDDGYSITWEYYATGPTWTALGAADGTEQLTKLGINSVSWLIPTDWLYASPDAALPDGYWIRARVSSAPSATAPPVQQLVPPFMPNTPFIDVPASKVTGDIEPLLRLSLDYLSGLQDDTETFDTNGRFNLDGEYDDSGGTFDATGTTIGVGGGGVFTEAWVTFENVTIPPGATILSATLYGTSAGVTNDPLNLPGGPADPMDVYGVLGNSDPIVQAVWETDRTTATLQWIPTAWDDQTEYSVAVTTIIDEIINDSGWQSGNGLGIIIQGDTVGGSDAYNFYATNSVVVSYDPWTLSITYEAMGQISRVVVGSRSTSRGSNFTPYIPMAGYAVNPNVYFRPIFGSVVASSLSVGPGYPTSLGRYVQFQASNYLPTTLIDRFAVVIGTGLAEEYTGTFRAYARIMFDGASGNDNDYMAMSVSAAGYTYDTHVVEVPQIQDQPLVVDFGDIRVPNVAQLSEVAFTIKTTDPYPSNILFLDLVLMPKDEWAAQFTSPSPTDVVDGGITIDRTLDIDGTGIVSQSLTARVTSRETGADVASYAVTNNAARLPVGQTSRIWFLLMRDRGFSAASEAGYYQSNPNTSASVRAFLANRYS